MATSGNMFDEDSAFRDRTVDELVQIVDDSAQSVVLRGRALLEVGRRAHGEPSLQERLFAWTNDDRLAAKRWMGPVTLSWIAACGLGHAVKDPSGRARIADALHRWPAPERELLLQWAGRESWFDGVA